MDRAILNQDSTMYERQQLIMISAELSNALTEIEAVHILGNGLASLLAYDTMAVYEADYDNQLLIPIALKGQIWQEHSSEHFAVPINTGIVGSVMASLVGELINNAHLDARSVYPKNLNVKEEHIIAIPLALGNRCWGAFLINRLGSKPFAQYEFETVRFVATYASYSLNNLKLSRTNSETKALKQLVFDTISDAIITINQQGLIIFCNEATEKIFGFSERELLNASITKIIPSSLRGKHDSSFSSYVTEGVRNLASWTSIELEGLCKDGSHKPVEISFGETTQSGKKIFSAVIRDITERKRAAEILHSKIHDATKEIAAQNEELIMQAEEISAQHDQLEIQNKRLAEIQKEIINQNLALENTVYNRTKELQIINEALNVQYEQLEQYSFIIAHNLRGPVARILGLVSVFDKAAISEYNKETLERLNESTKDLDTVVKDLGTILELRNKVNAITYDEIELNPLIDKIKNRLIEEIERTSATIELQITTNKINAPRVYLDSILYNLMSNSLKYRAPNRALVIRISMVQKEGINYLTISDNGIGFPDTNIGDKLFKPFQRFSLDTQLKGKGLGLYLVKTHVEAMKGKIEVSSQENKGTIFMLQWPDSMPG